MPALVQFDHEADCELAIDILAEAEETYYSVPRDCFLLPRWFLSTDGRQPVCTAHDENLLRRMLEQHFGGCTVGPSFMQGAGYRGAVLETNFHRQVTVLACRWRGTMRYFRALRQELEQCSGEQIIAMFC